MEYFHLFLEMLFVTSPVMFYWFMSTRASLCYIDRCQTITKWHLEKLKPNIPQTTVEEWNEIMGERMKQMNHIIRRTQVNMVNLARVLSLIFVAISLYLYEWGGLIPAAFGVYIAFWWLPYSECKEKQVEVLSIYGSATMHILYAQYITAHQLMTNQLDDVQIQAKQKGFTDAYNDLFEMRKQVEMLDGMWNFGISGGLALSTLFGFVMGNVLAFALKGWLS